MILSKVFAIAGLIALLAAGVLSMFPLWRSATLPADSVRRRTYWTGTAAATALLFLSQLPNWPAGLFVAGMIGLAMFTTAGLYTDFIKIAGRVYSASPQDRRRGRAVGRDEDDE